MMQRMSPAPLPLNGTEDTTLTISEADLLANASDVDGDALSVQNLTADGGTLTDNGDGSWSFTPGADFSGTVNLSYDVSDGTTTTAASGTITVAADADAPTLTLGAVSNTLLDQTTSQDSGFEGGTWDMSSAVIGLIRSGIGRQIPKPLKSKTISPLVDPAISLSS